MILAHHVTFSAYGFWLPNDPRGSGSDIVRSEHLRPFGKATKVTTRHSVAHREHDVQIRLTAKAALLFPAVHFNGLQARAIGRGFAQAVAEGRYVIHACSILPDHVHLVIALHERPIRKIVGHLKSKATRQLRTENLHPLADCHYSDGIPASPWEDHAWDVRLFTPTDVMRACRYVENNPLKEGKPRQHWAFVVPYGSPRTPQSGVATGEIIVG
ncbi:MAG: transposase [Phycisphaerales bacterium]|nr:transposase [Phycisphaerales bacterium]